MNTYEPKNKKFITLILFMVIAVASAKVLHDSNVSEADQTATELMAKEGVIAGKKQTVDSEK